MTNPVTQADRDAAADIYAIVYPPGDLRGANIRLGRLDDGPAVQAFAAHRLAAEAGIVAWLRTYPNVIGLSQMAAWNTAADIERREHAGEG